MTDLIEPHSENDVAAEPDSGQNAKSSGYSYCHTPEESHWKKGCPSPNAKGRPRGRKNDKVLVHQIFEKELVPAKIDGKTRRVSKRELSIRQVANKAAAGDLKAFDRAESLLARYAEPEVEEPTDQEHAHHLTTLDQFIALRSKFAPLDTTNEQA
jgi:hypothetical protein